MCSRLRRCSCHVRAGGEAISYSLQQAVHGVYWFAQVVALTCFTRTHTSFSLLCVSWVESLKPFGACLCLVKVHLMMLSHSSIVWQQPSVSDRDITPPLFTCCEYEAQNMHSIPPVTSENTPLSTIAHPVMRSPKYAITRACCLLSSTTRRRFPYLYCNLMDGGTSCRKLCYSLYDANSRRGQANNTFRICPLDGMNHGLEAPCS